MVPAGLNLLVFMSSTASEVLIGTRALFYVN